MGSELVSVLSVVLDQIHTVAAYFYCLVLTMGFFGQHKRHGNSLGQDMLTNYRYDVMSSPRLTFTLFAKLNL
jgi:hypothetical protein